MAEESNKKMGFWKRMLTSIKDFDQYQTFALENLGNAIKYLLLVMLLFTVIVSAVFTYQFTTTVTDVTNYIKNDISQVTYENGILTINENKPNIFEKEGAVIPVVILATGEENSQEYKEKLESYSSGILFLKDKLVFKNEMLSNAAEYNYQELISPYGITNFTKEDIVKMIDGANYIAFYSALFMTMVIYLFAIYTVSTLVDAIMLAVLGFIVARIAGMRIKFKATFNMGVHALTLPILLNLVYIIVNSFTGFEIKYFQWMYTTISYIYMIVAILIIKTDLINRQMELMKIKEVQDQVREELEKQEEKKKENQDTGKEEPEEKKEEEKKKKENETERVQKVQKHKGG